MSAQVKDKVSQFANAIEKRDTQKLNQLLHENFRVIANQYPTADKLSILPKEVYLKLISTGKIGGTKYDIEFNHVLVKDHSATVATRFKGKDADMYLTLLLIENNGEWKIIEDMALIE